MKVSSQWVGMTRPLFRGYEYFPTIHILPECSLSFERNPNRDVYLYLAWLVFGWQLHFCFCKEP